MRAPVLIVGAGPTGLNLGLWLHRHGCPFRIIDQHAGPAEESRALAVQARTLEFYAQLGLASDIVARGVKIDGLRIHEEGQERAHISLESIGEGLSPFPFVLDFPQDEHERFLVDQLRDRGVEIERETSLKTFSQTSDGVDVVLSGPNGEQTVRVDYLCGCDGARSAVRQGLGVGFGGGTYQHRYYVADVALRDGPSDHDFHLALGRDTFTLRLPARQGAMSRLIGFAPDAIEQPTFEDVRASAEKLLGVEVAHVNWFSLYKVHHRVADHFRIGRAFLLGDAGHLHSPVGGQGMNTGIGDAVNLAWKLAHVVRGVAPATLLDSYEPERISFARDLVATTDQVFKFVVSEGFAGEAFRRWILPNVVPTVGHFEAGRHFMFKILSQIRVAYPDSPLSSGSAGAVKGGDRLPWVESLDNFSSLADAAWQVHVFGEPAVDLTQAAAERNLPVHIFAFDKDARVKGFARHAAYLIRPDGYVALAMNEATGAALKSYFQKKGFPTGDIGAGPGA